MNEILQYVVVRKDLKWGVGAMMSQVSHVTIAAIVENYNDESTQKYILNSENMHTVILQAQSDTELKEISSNLIKNNIIHKIWTEKPENIQVCLATKPYQKNMICNIFNNLKLYR
eukprot:GHVL01041216.1.p1 GENE.GHVL01041216.1~~GHVL01041216.1.p1  ORF type:complete len:126 (+),score=22.47 GHVL01041216.1:34-378(+)